MLWRSVQTEFLKHSVGTVFVAEAQAVGMKQGDEIVVTDFETGKFSQLKVIKLRKRACVIHPTLGRYENRFIYDATYEVLQCQP